MTRQRWTLRNIARRPIEIHGPAEVAILAADETFEVDAIDDQHSALIARGLMTAHAAPPATAAPAPAASTPASATRVRKASTKTSRRKGEGA